MPDNLVAECPGCGEIVIESDACVCPLCARTFHLDCVDPETFCCLDCETTADVLDPTPRHPSRQDDDEERDERRGSTAS
ncbi:MAG: hypothetical protein HY710_06985 [Candidatus Latescibacteria bacterium]|nr:hypothetical protein [Candidatus Latescibacterota bacterium]